MSDDLNDVIDKTTALAAQLGRLEEVMQLLRQELTEIRSQLARLLETR